MQERRDIDMNYEKISGFSDEIAEDIDTQFRVLKKLNIKYFEIGRASCRERV